jgi:hypothetical protein
MSIISKERYEESEELIRRHLAPFHKDKDVNSLSCRFGELMQEYEELQWKLRSSESYGRIMYDLLVKEKNRKNNGENNEQRS